MLSANRPRQSRGCALAIWAVLLCPGLSGFSYLYKVIWPNVLTTHFSVGFEPVIEKFETVDSGLDAQLKPELILTVATEAYYSRFTQINESIHCALCDRFWVTTSAKTGGVCVLEYSLNRSVVRASVQLTGHSVDALTLKPLQPEEQEGLSFRTTYHLVRQAGAWKVDRLSGGSLGTQGEADLFQVLQEQFDELGCQ